MAELSPPVLHDLGLAAGLEWLGQQMARHRLAVTVANDPEAAEMAGRSTEDLRIMLFQSARELLMNVVKHSQVKTAGCPWPAERTALSSLCTMRGKDRSGEPRPAGGGVEHFGLFSLRERLEAFGGADGFYVKAGPRDRRDSRSLAVSQPLRMPGAAFCRDQGVFAGNSRPWIGGQALATM